MFQMLLNSLLLRNVKAHHQSSPWDRVLCYFNPVHSALVSLLVIFAVYILVVAINILPQDSDFILLLLYKWRQTILRITH